MKEITYWNKDLETLPREKIEKFQFQRFTETVKYNMSITPDVHLAGIGELPRFEMKAKRVIREDQ